MKIHEENKYLRDTNVQFTKDKIALETTIDELKNSISNLELQSEQAAQAIYNKTMESMSESLSHAAEKMGEDYQTAENEFKNEYLKVMEEFSNLM
jgi:gas vesicle protein